MRIKTRIKFLALAIVFFLGITMLATSQPMTNSPIVLSKLGPSHTGSFDTIETEEVSERYSPELMFMSRSWQTELPSSIELQERLKNPFDSGARSSPERNRMPVSGDYNHTSSDGSPLVLYSIGEQRPVPCEFIQAEPRPLNEGSTESSDNHGLGVLYSATGTDVGNPYSPDYYRQQEMQSPAKNGHWFPKKNYAVLAFMVDLPAYVVALDIRIDIEPDQDTYSRYFTLYFDNTIVHHAVIYPEGQNNGFHGYITVWWVGAGEHKIELEINYGGWKDRGWKMTYLQPFESAWPYVGNPILAFWEYFPHFSNIILEYECKGGSYTKISLCTENDNDPTTRILNIYVNGVKKRIMYSPGSYESSLYYNPPDGTTYVLGLELISPGTYYGKRILFNQPTYRVKRLEVDRMRNVQNDDWLISSSDARSMINYVRTYYILRGFTRFDYYIDYDFIPYDGWLSVQDFRNIRSAYFDYDYDPWQYCLIANKDSTYPISCLGWWLVDGSGFAIFEGCLSYLAGQPDAPSLLAHRRLAFMHEFNHDAGIVILNNQGGEQYCPNPECAMAMASSSNIVEAPWTCQYYWAERDAPWI